VDYQKYAGSPFLNIKNRLTFTGPVTPVCATFFSSNGRSRNYRAARKKLQLQVHREIQGELGSNINKKSHSLSVAMRLTMPIHVERTVLE
jgi:hypothetical protein